MGERKPIPDHETTTAHCPQCKKRKAKVPMERGKIPDGIPWKCKCGAMGNTDVFDDGTFLCIQRGGYPATANEGSEA